jgi:acyl dehydratase
MTTTTEAPQFNLDAVGQWSDPVEFEVERERIKAYAEATNDPIEAHRSGDLAPPVFAIVPAFQALSTSSVSVMPPELIMRVLHGEQDFHFHRPIEPGVTLSTRSAVVGVHGRSSGVTVLTKGETRDAASDELLVTQYMNAFVRGAQVEQSTGEEPPPHAFDESLREREPDATVEQTFDEDQTFRYSEASGDPMPVHLDEEVAKSVGLPGIIIHGLCTMAFTSVAVIGHACPEDPARLSRLAVRFSKVVQPKQTITTRTWSAGEADGRNVYAYETTSDSGDVVIKDGLAEIERSS